MRAIRYQFESEFDCSVDALWAFHERPDALELLTPPGAFFEVRDRGQGLADGSVVEATVGPGPLRRPWRALHAHVRPGRGFVDLALESPFRYWVHQHVMEPVEGGRARLRDVIWLVPPRWLPRPIARPLLAAALKMMFAWRHARTRREVEPVSRRGPSLDLPVGDPPGGRGGGRR